MKSRLFVVTLSLFLTSCASSNRVNDMLISVSNKNIILKQNEKTYKLKVNINIVGDISYIVNNNDIFITSLGKHIVKISLDTKTIDWVKELSTTPQNNFVFDDNFIYFNGFDNNFYILNYETGDIENIIFNTKTSTITDTRKPYLYNNKIVVFFNNKEVYIIENKKNVIKTLFYKYSVDIKDDKIIIDNNEVIKL